MSIASEVSVEEESVDSNPIRPQGGFALTVVTSALNEGGNVLRFLDEVFVALRELEVSGEILFIDDGSRDGTSTIVADYARRNREFPVRLIRHPNPMGLAQGINEAASLARGEFVCFLPADLESLPSEDIPKLFSVMTDDVDVVLGCRVGRGDQKLLASWLYKQLNRWVFGVHVRDGNWLKLVRTERLAGIRLQNDWHPFLVPILAHAGCRFAEVDTLWRPRQYGHSKFGLKRIPKSLAAAVSVKMYLRFGSRPLVFFLATATVLFGLSGLLLLLSFVFRTSGTWFSSASLSFSAAFMVAGWISLLGGLTLDLLSRQLSEKTND
jgi:glycosyltransferase involved in cell wall biosynthesis